MPQKFYSCSQKYYFPCQNGQILLNLGSQNLTTSIGSLKMKEGIHPNYQPVVFVDANTGKEYITRSTKSSAEKKTIDGVEYSVISLEITADTHPFWTGKQHRVDTAGRIDRFNKRFAGNITGAKRKTRKAAPAKAEDAE